MAKRMRRAGLMAALALLMAAALAGVAYAENIGGTPDNDYLLGTVKDDLISGGGETITSGLSQGTTYCVVALVMT